jgi:hypothetical protein
MFDDLVECTNAECVGRRGSGLLHLFVIAVQQMSSALHGEPL